MLYRVHHQGRGHWDFSVRRARKGGAVQLRMLRGLLHVPDDPTGGVVRKNIDNPHARRYQDRIGD